MKDNDHVAPLFVLILGFLFGMILASLISCEKINSDTVKKYKELTVGSEISTTNVIEYTYQGCEYIVVGPPSQKWGSHKGNCKNPIHKK